MSNASYCPHECDRFFYFHDHDDGHYDDRLSSVVWHVPSIKLKAEPNGQDNG